MRRFMDLRLWLGVAFIAFQVWILLHPQQPLFERPVHLIFAMALLFLWRPLRWQGGLRLAGRVVDGLLLAGVAGIAAYYLIEGERLSTRIENVSEILPVDIAAAAVLFVLLMEGVRRAVGMVLFIVIAIFLLYVPLGPYMPSWLYFRGFGIPETVEIMTMTTTGILGVTTATSAQFVFYFIIFGSIYAAVGGGQLFIDVALRLAGRATGGAPKAAIISSSLMGTISGSAVANVTATGVFTIPLMRRCGLSAERAGAYEAIASTGGQLMPPIMGVAAFVMAELLNVPYARIALAGLIPAVAFYLSLYLIADLSSRRDGTERLPESDMQNIARIMPRLHLLLPPLILIGSLMWGYSAQYAAVQATVASLLAAFLHRSTFMSLDAVLEAIRDATKQVAEIAVPIAAIGIIIAVSVQSNLALKFAGAMIGASGGTAIGSLVLVILGCIIMGMGLPTVAAYIIGAVLYVPALKGYGISALSAHFFIFYYCVLSMVTPPVALAAYAAAGLSGGGVMRTSMAAFGLSAVAFFVPFSFIYDEAVLFTGSYAKIAYVSAGLFLATTIWAVSLGGYWRRRLSNVERGAAALLGLTAVLAPTGTLAWGIGLGLGTLLLVWFWYGPQGKTGRTPVQVGA
ncbi:MAG: TRAP transporter permease [Beijerinckiaceae bacterium]